MTLTKVQLEKIVLTPVSMEQVMMTPVTVNLGPQLLSNSQFSDMTIGAEVNADPGFDDPLEWSTGGSWVVSGSTATHTTGDSNNITANTNTTTIGECYQVTNVTLTNDEIGGSQRYASARWCNEDLILPNGAGTNVGYVTAAGGNNPTKITMRSAVSSAGVGDWVTESMSVKPVSLDGFTRLGTISLTEWNLYDAENKTVRIVSGGAQMGITQTIPTFVTGDYYYSIFVDSKTGDLKLSNPTDGDIASISSTGENKGIISITDGDLQLEADGACDVIVSAFTIYRVL